MRKIYFLLLFACALFTQITTTAQTTVVIPTGNPSDGSMRQPLGTWYGFERSALIYTQAELGGISGQISAISFYVNTLSTPGAMTNVRVYLKARADGFTAPSNYVDETTGATLVYGPVTIPASALTAGQWFTINLTTGFTYNGSGNIEVIVETNATGGGNETGSGKGFRARELASNSTAQYWQDDGAAPAGPGTLSVNRPNIQFTITEPPCVSSGLTGGTIASSVMASCPGTNFNLSVTGASSGAGLTYQWQSSPDGGTWTDIGGATEAAFSTQQTAATHYRRKITCAGTDAYSNSIQVTASSALTIPFTETFAGFATTFPSSCWSVSSSTFIQGNASSAYGDGLGSAQFGFYNTSNTLELVTPGFTPVPANHRVTFDHAYATFIFGEVDELVILYSTDGGATYQPLTALAGGTAGPLNTGGASLGEFLPTSAQWASKAFALPVGTNRLMFRGVSAFGNNLYLDNIRVQETPPCLPPVNLNSAAVSPTQHQISWGASPSNPGVGYQWEIRTSGAAGSGAAGLAASGTTTAAVLTATASALAPSTAYSYYVRAHCGVGLFSDWTLAGTFTTVCNPTNLPYVQNFDGAVSPNLPACIVTQDLNGGGNWQMWYDGDIVTSSAPNSIRYVYNATVPGNDWFFLQGLNLEAGKTYTLGFKYKASDGPTWVENLEVKYGLQPNAASMTSAAIFNAVNIESNVDSPFEIANVTFTVPANGAYYLGFRCYSDADMAYLFIDDITVEACPTPTGLTAMSALPTTANVSYTASGGTIYVEYGAVGFTPGTGAAAGTGGTVVTGTLTGAVLSSLTANTLYDVYVRRDCGGGEFSGNAKTTIRTLCAPTAVPYTQDFTGVAVPALPTCTSLQDLNGNPTWGTFTPAAAWGFNGTTIRYLYDAAKPGNDWFFIQGISLTAGKQYEVSYKYGSTDPLYPESMKVALGTEAQASAMTTTLADYPTIFANAAAPFAKLGRVKFTVPADGAYYVGFQAYSAADQFQLFLDSIVVREIPPVDVGITGLSNAPTCPANNFALNATLHNFNLDPIDFSVYPITVTANVTGSGTAALTTTVNSGTLAPGANLTVTLPAFNFTQGVYTIATATSSPDDGVAGNNSSSLFLVVNGAPAAAVFTPANPQVCEGGTVQVSTQFTTPAPAPSTTTLNSGAINQAIPDNSTVGTNHTLNVTGIPATAVVTGVSVTLNATHTWNSDMIFTLRAPNGRVLTLANAKGGSGDGYTNAIFSSTGTTALPTANTTPITGTFAPDATLGVGATGFIGNATSFANLYTVGNGAWTLSVRDAAGGDVGTLVSWTLAVTYGQPHPVVTWTPATSLFTDAAATTAYVANSNAYSVYVKPAANTAYTVTSTSGFGCVTTSTVNVTVNPNPVVNIAALPTRICVSDPVIALSASPVGGSWTGSGISGNNLVPAAIGITGTFPLTYRYTNNFGCTSTATVIAKVEECPERVRLLRDDALVLFPNPNNGQFNIRINSTLYNKLTMRVYTTSGMAVRTQEFTGLAYGRVIPVDLTSLPSGAYMVQFMYFGGPRTSEKVFNVVIGK